MYRPWLHRYAVALACSTFLLLVAGGLVTSNAAGLSVASWPLIDFGEGTASAGALYKIAHRVMAALVGLATIGLALSLRRMDRRAWMRRLGVFAVLAVIAQGLMGGVAVRWFLPQTVSVLHAVSAGLFFAITVAMAAFTSRSWIEGPAPAPRNGRVPLFPLAAVAAAAMLAQLALGAALRHGMIGAAPHVAGAALAGILGLWAVWRVLVRHGAHTQLRRSALALLTLGVSQAVLGMGAYLSRAALAHSPQPPPGLALVFSVSHVAAGAAALGAAVVLALYAWRSTAGAGAAAEAA